MTSMMISVLRMPAQEHSPREPTTAAATISTPPRPRPALQDGGAGGAEREPHLPSRGFAQHKPRPGLQPARTACPRAGLPAVHQHVPPAGGAREAAQGHRDVEQHDQVRGQHGGRVCGAARRQAAGGRQPGPDQHGPLEGERSALLADGWTGRMPGGRCMPGTAQRAWRGCPPEALSLASSSCTDRSVEKDRRRPASRAMSFSLPAASRTKAASHASAASLQARRGGQGNGSGRGYGPRQLPAARGARHLPGGAPCLPISRTDRFRAPVGWVRVDGECDHKGRGIC